MTTITVSLSLAEHLEAHDPATCRRLFCVSCEASSYRHDPAKCHRFFCVRCEQRREEDRHRALGRVDPVALRAIAGETPIDRMNREARRFWHAR